jgi:hypothetical protein
MPRNSGKEEEFMAEGYIGKIKNSGTQIIKAPNQISDVKKGKVKSGDDLRNGSK